MSPAKRNASSAPADARTDDGAAPHGSASDPLEQARPADAAAPTEEVVPEPAAEAASPSEDAAPAKKTAKTATTKKATTKKTTAKKATVKKAPAGTTATTRATATKAAAAPAADPTAQDETPADAADAAVAAEPVTDEPAIPEPVRPVPTPPAGDSPDLGSAAGESSEPTDADGGGLRVVVAEDEALIRLDLAEMLQDAGYDVVGQAPDGQQAVALVRELRPDLVVMDVKMPELDGISAAELIGAEHLAPVVMLTAFSDRSLVERARDAGVMAYVVKPFTIEDLRPAIDIARSRWHELRALESEIADLGERLETRKAVDRAKGVLMTQLKLSEPDAFRWIQKTAMDRRLGMREVAEAVITGLPGKR